MVIDRYQYSKYGNFQISCVLFIQDGVQDGRQCIVRFRKLCKLVGFYINFVIHVHHFQLVWWEWFTFKPY